MSRKFEVRERANESEQYSRDVYVEGGFATPLSTPYGSFSFPQNSNPDYRSIET